MGESAKAATHCGALLPSPNQPKIKLESGPSFWSSYMSSFTITLLMKISRKMYTFFVNFVKSGISKKVKWYMNSTQLLLSG